MFGSLSVSHLNKKHHSNNTTADTIKITTVSKVCPQQAQTMKTILWFLLSAFVVCTFLPCHASAGRPSPPTPNKAALTPPRRRKTRYDRFLDSVFAKADTDKDGRMSITETYEWVLQLYVKLNRQAPINPPTLAQVKRIHALMDDDRSNHIGQDEFRDLAEFFVGRATVRVVGFKIIRLVVAPLTAEALLRWFQKQDALYQAIVEPYVAPRLIPVITNPVIGRTILMILTMMTLGGVVMEAINDFLDHHLEQKEAAEMEAMAAAMAAKKQKKRR